MAEGTHHSSQGGRSYGGRKPGSGRPGNRGGKGFKPRGNGGKRFGGHGGNGYKPRHRDDFRNGGEGEHRQHDGERRFHDGERRFHDGERRFHDGERRFRDGGRRQHDGERRQHDGGNRSFHHGNGQGNRSGFRRSGGYRDDSRNGGNPRYRDNNRDFRDKNRDESRQHVHRHDDERHEFTQEEKRQYRETKRKEYLSKPRRNSDGTMSFPSQNPYTDRRPGEPKMPKGLEWSMLSKDERERLRGLSKEHAENIGLHILAAFAQEEHDPENALEHAKWAAKQASRIDYARETLAFIAYRQGDYKLAMREFRTAYRMNGYPDYLPFIADCERGLGNPKKAIELATSDDAKYLRGEAKAEMFLVYAGALGDLKLWDKAVEVVHTLGRSKGLAGAYRMRAIQAEQFFLEQAGRIDDAVALDSLLDKLELQYADVDEDESDEDVLIDYDLQHMSEDVLEEIGITADDARFAPDDDVDEETEDSDDETDAEDSDDKFTVDEEVREILTEAGIDDSDDETEAGDDESALPAQEAEEGATSTVEPATGDSDGDDSDDEA